LFVTKPLAFGLSDGDLGPLRVGNRSVIPTEREFVAIAVEMLFADVVERANYPALQ
jgi:hypothetical protein